jgi:uncharacterized protein (TIGR00369 family)
MSDVDVEKSVGRIAKGLGLIPYMAHLGMEFVEGGDGWCKVALRFQKENTTAADALHGGAIASLIDTTGAMAAWTTAELGNPRYFGSTVGVNVNYLSGLIGEDAIAEGRVLKRGKEIIYSDVKVSNPAGKLCAQGTVVYRIIDRGEQPGPMSS